MLELASDAAVAQQGSTMSGVFFRTACRFPERTAMVDAFGSTSFRDLADRVARVAAVLGARGISRGDTVAQLAGNSIDAWCVQFATYALGARFVGLHERSADDDLRFVLQDAEATLLVVDDRVHPGRDEALSETVT